MNHHPTMHTTRFRRPLASLCLLGSAILALTACGGGSDEQEVSRADVRAARTERGQQAVATTTAAFADRSTEPARLPWVPKVTDTWQWQLTGTINTSYDVNVYDIDLFEAPDAVMNKLHSEGRAIVCYFSAGSAENWRPDYNQFKPADLGKNLDGWPGERWVDTRSANVRKIMKARLDLAKQRGCDGVEPDNVEAYNNNPGFDGELTAKTQLNYNRFLATEAHARGLKIGLKNDIGQLKALEPSFDFAVNEQCQQYNECGGYSVFTGKGKPVFSAEYKKIWRDDADARAQMCAKARSMNLRTLVLPLGLNDAFRYSCD
ncbi:MAG TPA: endo alpha-1,4 polygalactosaminidase [Ideonella sp.]|uniref:endo alpha-1,4 polygalactosaminidase n=1 Tax=Ideonella sp. TaxID=1929293 RepID=UPI002E2FE5FD|nr:endo alpha-1,4 polygalactosaminidase [Ideonella sp.]HEX5685750.1 endo alpha-1,4 polygalactosaminidase [Ideonella sp.]